MHNAKNELWAKGYTILNLRLAWEAALTAFEIMPTEVDEKFD